MTFRAEGKLETMFCSTDYTIIIQALNLVQNEIPVRF